MAALASSARRSATQASHQRLPRAERERQMLEVAHALFAERGFAAVTMDEIADAVGVTKPLLYTYFGNKERLYLACMEPAGDALVKTVVDAVSATSTPADALDAGMRAFFGFLAEDRNAWRVLFDETLPVSGQIAQRVADYRSRLTELVTQALLAQMTPARRRRHAQDVEVVAVAMLGAAEALGRWWLSTEKVSAERAAELMIQTLSPGLRSSRESSGGSGA